MFPIASYTAPAGGSGGAVFFSNIPQTFTHLQFRCFTRSGNSATTNGIYQPGNAFHQILGNGASISAYSVASTVNYIGNTVANTSTANVFSSTIIDILDYTNTNKNKTLRVLAGYDANGSGLVELDSALLNSTAAVTGWFFDVGGPNYFAQYSRFDLYGISTSNVTGA
jgi:hypothetical protein